ncbi:hypothetical protein [Niallia sp.]|nr:hypothetical protein [Niallia sp.]
MPNPQVRWRVARKSAELASKVRKVASKSGEPASKMESRKKKCRTRK